MSSEAIDKFGKDVLTTTIGELNKSGKVALDCLKTDFEEAKKEIEGFLDGKKESYKDFSTGVADGTLPKELVESNIKSEQIVIEAILLKYALKQHLANEAKAKALALTIAEKVIVIIFQAIVASI